MRSITLFVSVLLGACSLYQMAPPSDFEVKLYEEPGIVHVQISGVQEGWPIFVSVRCDSNRREALVQYELPFTAPGAILVPCSSDLGVLVLGDPAGLALRDLRSRDLLGVDGEQTAGKDLGGSNCLDVLRATRDGSRVRGSQGPSLHPANP